MMALSAIVKVALRGENCRLKRSTIAVPDSLKQRNWDGNFCGGVNSAPMAGNAGIENSPDASKNHHY